MEDAARHAYQFLDEGTGRDPGRPRFAELLTAVRMDAAAGGRPVIIAAELNRLFRNRDDRAQVDALLDEGIADVLTAREGVDTTEQDGRERYDRVADLTVLAYEGEPLQAGSRAEVVDRYVDEVLGGWLELTGVPAEERERPLEDVRARLRALARRWDMPEGRVLLAPYVEVAENHEPAELPLEVRELALAGVRNSDLETLHLDDHIRQYDWRMLTQAAAYALAELPELPPGDLEPSGEDPFMGVIEANPTAAAAFAALREAGLGERVEWELPDCELPALTLETAVVPVNEDGADVLHAMDERVPQRIAQRLAEYPREPGAYLLPSLKHMSRNPRKLFAVVDYILAHGGEVVTANVHLGAGFSERRARVAGYNETDFAWALPDADVAFVKPGRNDPCPCGSGKKYKRCCGR